MSDEKKLNNAVNDAKDAAHEAEHRVKAGTEHLKRDIAGEAMTPVDRAASKIKEAGHNVAADVDKTKRDIRDKN